ncbi:hypothetical protein [Sinorhizobium meliloti]|uniref:hypothetical protein n=1 Tax=Rhizobium meliloti TaxID=382 RepID=UPI0013E4053F|nr:hypothetical protein [Sinorhizobium meliloti]MDW9820790.1 hypothetical protein [Sinorhizobium meliloti]
MRSRWSLARHERHRLASKAEQPLNALHSLGALPGDGSGCFQHVAQDIQGGAALIGVFPQQLRNFCERRFLIDQQALVYSSA